MITFFRVTGKPEKTAGISARNAKTNAEIPYKRFPHVAGIYENLLKQRKAFYMRKEFNFHRIGLEHTNMAALTFHCSRTPTWPLWRHVKTLYW